MQRAQLYQQLFRYAFLLYIFVVVLIHLGQICRIIFKFYSNSEQCVLNYCIFYFLSDTSSLMSWYKCLNQFLIQSELPSAGWKCYEKGIKDPTVVEAWPFKLWEFSNGGIWKFHQAIKVWFKTNSDSILLTILFIFLLY